MSEQGQSIPRAGRRAASAHSSELEADDAEEWEPGSEEEVDSDVDISSSLRAGPSEQNAGEVELEPAQSATFLLALKSFYRSRGRAYLVSSSSPQDASVGRSARRCRLQFQR
jgi:hypothetical protein